MGQPPPSGCRNYCSPKKGDFAKDTRGAEAVLRGPLQKQYARARDGQGGVCLETANFPNNTRAGGPHPKPPNFAINTITWAGPLLGQ
jgi:hypothetical protein